MRSFAIRFINIRAGYGYARVLPPPLVPEFPLKCKTTTNGWPRAERSLQNRKVIKLALHGKR